MELIFNAEEVKALLIEKTNKLGIKANAVEFNTSYGTLGKATVYYSFDLEPKTEIRDGHEITLGGA